MINDLQKIETIELEDIAYNAEIPIWQQKEVLARLQSLKNNPEEGIDWEMAMKRINELTHEKV